MNELSDNGSESTEDSNDMMWETIKVDLGLNRACQTEQLQSLKGSSVKLPPSKLPVRRRLKSSLKARIRFHSKKAALQTALGMIRAVTRRVKVGRKVPTDSHGCTSGLNFKVVDNAPEMPVSNEHSLGINGKSPATEAGGNNVSLKVPTLKDEATQTKPVSLADKSLQTSLQDDHNLQCCAMGNVHHTMSHKACGMTCLPFASCCPRPVVKLCHCLVSCQTEGSLPSNKQVPSPNGNISPQYTLKQICDELLVQLSARRAIIPEKQAATNSSNKKCSAETSNSPSDAAVGELKQIVNSLQSIQNDLKRNTVVHQHIVPTSITIARAETKSQCLSPVQFETISSKPTSEEQQRTQEPAQVQSGPVPSCVTPDLLQLVGESTRFSTSTPAEDKFENIAPFKAPFPPKIIEQSKVATDSTKVDPIETFNWPTMIALEENSDKLLQQMLDAGLVTIVNSAANINQNETSDKDSADQILSDLNSAIKNNDFQTDGAVTSKESSVANSSDDFVLVLEAEENNQNTMCEDKTSDHEPHLRTFPSEAGSVNTSDPKIDVCNTNTSSSQSSSSDIDVVGKPDEIHKKRTLDSKLLGTKANTDMFNNLKTEVPSKIIGTDSKSTEMEIMSSYPFEDVDTTDMENILAVWRQQEKLHQVQYEPEKSPISFEPYLFKMSRNRPRVKTPENFRMCQSPTLQKGQQSSSASQLLQEKRSDSAVEDDDDDVPEVSPSVLPTPKKRRLSLKKTSSSPLPVVFHSKPKAVEGIKNEGINSPKNDNSHSSSPVTPQQLEGSKESTNSEADDDDTPLSLRSLKLKNAPSKNTKRKSLSLKGSSKKQDDAVKEDKTSVDKPLKSSRKGKSKNVEKLSENKGKDPDAKGTEPSKKGKSKTDGKETGAIDEKKTDATDEKETLTYSQIIAMAKDMHDKEQDFKDQMCERNQTMKRKWLQGKTNDGGKELDLVHQPGSPILPKLGEDSLFQEKVQMLREISCYELGKAHDMAVNILLNPWRGINARKVTRDYDPPKHDNKNISRLLWDLRSGANPDEIVNRIMAMGWGEVNPSAMKSMVSMFVLSLSRSVPFIIEATKNNEEDDTCSIVSDLDQNAKKKATSVRVIATRHIFKGECLEGMNGLILKLGQQDKGKDKLKSWVLPKLGGSRNFALLGPLAYLKRKEENSNTEALILKGDIVVVKAMRQILSGERLLISFKRLEKSLC